MSNKKDKTSITIPVIAFPASGHKPHRSGAGKHLDKRTKRQRTREAQRRAAINE